MEKTIKLAVFFLLILQSLCGCTMVDEEEKISVPTNTQDKLTKTHYKGFIQKESKLSIHEPIKGSYLGAYVLSNPEINYDIKEFEESVGRNVAIDIRHYQLGDNFPNKWLLQCLANNKSPYIIITPSNIDDPYDYVLLEETVRGIKSSYCMPVFIDFYPNAKDFGESEKYVEYFRKARGIFNKHLDNTAFVWSTRMEDIYDSMLYYPGDNYVDWVGINMSFPIYKDKKRNSIDIDNNLNYFYNMYQDRKPMFISNLAVSHYSNYDHAFYIEEASHIINKIYSEIPIYYPRIKGINYMDYDNIKNWSVCKGDDNFRVSTESRLTNIYKKAISTPDYLENVSESKSKKAYNWNRMYSPIYKYNDGLYIQKDTIIHDLSRNQLKNIQGIEFLIGGEEYYKLDELSLALNHKYIITEDIIRIYK